MTADLEDCTECWHPHFDPTQPSPRRGRYIPCTDPGCQCQRYAETECSTPHPEGRWVVDGIYERPGCRDDRGVAVSEPTKVFVEKAPADDTEPDVATTCDRCGKPIHYGERSIMRRTGWDEEYDAPVVEFLCSPCAELSPPPQPAS